MSHMTAEERREKAIAEIVGIDKLSVGEALPLKTTHEWLAFIDKAYEAGRSAGLDEAAELCKQRLVIHEGEIMAADIRKLKEK